MKLATPIRWTRCSIAGPLVLGGLLLAGALVIRFATGPDSFWRLLIELLEALGVLVTGLGLLNRFGLLGFLGAQMSLALATGLLTVAVLEGLGRWARVDFHKLDRHYRALAPFYRKPDVPVGEGLWRRAGPLVWRGQVLRSGVRALGLPDEAFRTEAPVQVRYDADGFRNETNDREWEVAVAGDSFTELGHLPFADLFTTHLARRTGWRVRNLGVSHTGPLSHLLYLRRWGISPATRHLVIAFYEGNDLEDLSREVLARDRFRQGRPLPPDLPPQTSLLGWLVERLLAPPTKPFKGPPLPDYWLGPQGAVPVTLSDLPPAAAEVTPEQRRELHAVLGDLARLSASVGASAWLVYLPAKRHVLHGQLRFQPTADPSLRDWQPTDLPGWVRALCADTGVRFVDLTPPLRAVVVEEGELPFNALFDTHLNSTGARVVGEALARALTADPLSAPPADTRGE